MGARRLMARASVQPAAPVSRWRYPAAVLLVLLVPSALATLVLALSGGHTRTGFLGTNASQSADINLVLHGLMVASLLVGAHLAHVGDIRAHRINQTSIVLVNLVSIASVMLVSFARVVLPSASRPGDPLVAVAAAHGLLGLTTEGMGLYLLLRMNNLIPPRWRFGNFKLFMRATLMQWLVVTAYGGLLYWVWYAPVPTDSTGANQAAPAAQPVPTTLAAAAGPIGSVEFSDEQARNDQLRLAVDGIEPLGSGSSYVAWLSVSGRPESRLGPLSLSANNSARLIASTPDRANLVASFDGLILSAEPAGVAPNQPGLVRYRAELPPKALVFLRQALASLPGAPNTTSAAAGALEQAEELQLHVDLARGAARANDVAGVQRHAEHVVNLLEGQQGANFGDRNSDGRIQNPGDGFGLLESTGQPGYLKGLAEVAGLAAAAEDATATIKVHAGHVQLAVENARRAATVLRDLALEAVRPQTTTRAAQLAEQMGPLALQLAVGTDANGDGQIEPIVGEGGVKVAYVHAQFMAAMSILPVAASLDGSTPAVLPPQPSASELVVQPTRGPGPSPVSSAPGAPLALDIANFQFGGKGLSIKVGTPITWTNRDRAPHTVTADGKQFDSGNLSAGQSFRFAPTSAGAFPYYCELHGDAGGQGMSGLLTVVP
jgi:plastocyanin